MSHVFALQRMNTLYLVDLQDIQRIHMIEPAAKDTVHNRQAKVCGFLYPAKRKNEHRDAVSILFFPTPYMLLTQFQLVNGCLDALWIKAVLFGLLQHGLNGVLDLMRRIRHMLISPYGGLSYLLHICVLDTLQANRQGAHSK